MAHNDPSDGWGDEDDLDLSSGGVGAPANNNNNLFAPAGDDDDFFGSMDAKPAKAPLGKKAMGKKLALPSKKAAAPAVTKLSIDDDVEDGWDDF